MTAHQFRKLYLSRVEVAKCADWIGLVVGSGWVWWAWVKMGLGQDEPIKINVRMGLSQDRFVSGWI